MLGLLIAACTIEPAVVHDPSAVPRVAECIVDSSIEVDRSVPSSFAPSADEVLAAIDGEIRGTTFVSSHGLEPWDDVLEFGFALDGPVYEQEVSPPGAPGPDPALFCIDGPYLVARASVTVEGLHFSGAGEAVVAWRSDDLDRDLFVRFDFDEVDADAWLQAYGEDHLAQAGCEPGTAIDGFNLAVQSGPQVPWSEQPVTVWGHGNVGCSAIIAENHGLWEIPALPE